MDTWATDRDNSLPRFFNSDAAHCAHLRVPDAPEPLNLIRGLKKRVIAENGRVLPLHDIVDFPDCFAGDVPDRWTCSGTKSRLWGSTWPVLDESASLFWATTGIALVHEPALVVHEAVQVPARAGQTLTEVVGSHLQDLAADGIAGAENLAEREDQSLLAVQTQQHSHRAAVLASSTRSGTATGTLFGSGKSRSGVLLMAAP